MSHVKHPDLRSPDNPNARIWRFMDLAKFLDLIHSRQLHLRRGDCFDDPYEGMMRDEEVSALTDPERRIDRIAWHAQRRADYYVTCWHLSEDEPAGMWKLYGGSDGGVAITSTYDRLQRALDAWAYEPSYMGLVEYESHSWDVERPSSDILALLHKRRNFVHEREVRGLVRVNGAGGIGRNIDPEGRAHEMPFIDPVSSKDFRLNVDVEELLTGVVLSPAAPGWWAPLIKGVVERYGYRISVAVSELYRMKYLSSAAVGSQAPVP